MTRKILNVVMSLTGPIMYAVFSRLPYIVSSVLCVMYAVGFIFLTERQKRNNEKLLIELLELNDDLDEDEGKELVAKALRMTVASKEQMARFASLYHNTAMMLEDDVTIEEDEKFVEEGA